MKYVTDRATDHTTDCIITTEQLTKKYKNFTSVNNVSHVGYEDKKDHH